MLTLCFAVLAELKNNAGCSANQIVQILRSPALKKLENQIVKKLENQIVRKIRKSDCKKI